MFQLYLLHNQKNVLQVPGKGLYSKIDKNEFSVLPSGRFVKPVGKVSTITHDPFGLTISKDGKYAVSLHNGVLTIYNLLNDSIIRVPDYKRTISSPFSKGSLLGASFYRDNKTIFFKWRR